jgi:hypothetical protein
VVVNTREDRFESDSLSLEGVDRDGIENKSRISCTHRRPEKSPGSINCDPATEIFGWIWKGMRVFGGTLEGSVSGRSRSRSVTEGQCARFPSVPFDAGARNRSC